MTKYKIARNVADTLDIIPRPQPLLSTQSQLLAIMHSRPAPHTLSLSALPRERCSSLIALLLPPSPCTVPTIHRGMDLISPSLLQFTHLAPFDNVAAMKRFLCPPS